MALPQMRAGGFWLRHAKPDKNFIQVLKPKQAPDAVEMSTPTGYVDRYVTGGETPDDTEMTKRHWLANGWMLIDDPRIDPDRPKAVEVPAAAQPTPVEMDPEEEEALLLARLREIQERNSKARSEFHVPEPELPKQAAPHVQQRHIPGKR